MADNKVVYYEQMKQFTKDPKVLIVDVREPAELEKTGKIDGSINIPLATLEDALKNTDEKFQEKYGKSKPNQEIHLVFTCQMGGRALRALNLASKIGFNNGSYYKGSWSEWEKKNNEN